MTINDQIRDEKLQYNINREAAKISALSSNNIGMYEYLTGEEILPSIQRKKKEEEQAKFTHSPLGKAFEKKKKKSHWRWRGKQVEALKYLKLKEQTKEIEDKSDNKFSIQKENYDKLLDERADEIGNTSREINSIYYFTTPGIAPINFIKFKGPLNIFKKIRDGDKTLQEIE